MNTEDLGNSKILNLLFKPAGIMMESRLRQWLMNPVKTLRGAGIQPGQTVLEVGCGTGFSLYYKESTHITWISARIVTFPYHHRKSTGMKK